MPWARRRWDVVWDISFPFARNGIVGAFVLSLGRALGETMAVAMTIGGGFHLPTTIMDQGYTLASVIANEFNEVSSETLPFGVDLLRPDPLCPHSRSEYLRVFHREETGRYSWLQRLTRRSQAHPLRGRRKWPGILGFGITAVATLISLGALFSILGYLIIHGSWRVQLELSRQGTGGRRRGRRRHRPVPAGHRDSRQYLHDYWRAARRGSRYLLVRTGRRHSIRQFHAPCD